MGDANMISERGVDAFVRLFRGRSDAKGSWTGGAMRTPVRRQDFERHLTSNSPRDWMGCYPVIGHLCSWGCVDIDEDGPLLAAALVDVLATHDVYGYIEKTAHGYHVWVFPELEPTPLLPAADMRRALMAACLSFGYTPKEVNPKQEQLAKGQLGNYVRCPLPGVTRYASVPAERALIMWEGFHVPRGLESCLIALDRDGRTSHEAIAKLAAQWEPPPKSNWRVDLSAGMDVENIVQVLGGLSYTIWKDGVLDGNDRSGTLAHLAHLLAEERLEPRAAFKVLCSADARMGGKFTDRGESGLAIISRLLADAYDKEADDG